MSGRRFWLRRVLPITAAVSAMVVVAAFVVKVWPGAGGGSRARASQVLERPLPPAPVVAALQRLQAQIDSSRLAEQARAVTPRERASFVQHGSPFPSGVKFDLRSLRYVDLARHAYVATPTTAADIRATDAAGESYMVRLYRTPAGRWLLVETVPTGAATRAASAATARPVSASLLSQDMVAAPSSCAVDVGTRVPVILVHGWNGSPADWGSPSDGGSMIHVIASMPGVYAEPFDYHQFASSWVTNPAIGPALAQRIDCLARSSLRGGGLGKVILVDHSMGGLATRYAASQTVGGRRVSDELGLVVTIGTPNLGTAWANFADPLQAAICNSAGTVGPFPSGSPCGDYSALQGLSRDSAQISALPWLPPSVPLRAIAGDVTLSATLFNNTVTDDTSSNLLVGVNSALAAGQSPTSLDEGTGDHAFH
jgi:pimeloyl-ACP methyl ester carboxylesterase